MASSATQFDTDCKLMLHMDDAGLSDSSASPKAVTLNGNVARTSGQSKFGGHSAVFDGSGDFLTIPDSPDWNIGTSDFTIDFWVRYNSVSGYDYLFSRNGNGFAIRRNSTDYEIVISGGVVMARTLSPSINTWYHIALVRSGTDLRLFNDGVQAGATVTNSSDLSDSTGIEIGGSSASGDYLDGWQDEFRFVKGTAVWTANFPPPSAAYTPPLSGNFFLMF